MIDILMDHKTGRLLYREEIEELYKTEEGRFLLKEYMLSAKIAYAAQEAMNYMHELDKKISEFTDDEITGICDVLYMSIKYAKWDKVEKYLKEAVRVNHEEDSASPYLC